MMEPIQIKFASGDESISSKNLGVQASLKDFWAWAYSDCLNNTTRGVLAEFIVALALGIDVKKPRDAWAKYDLEYNGIGIEVKSASFHQRWAQKKLSSIQFHIPATRAWTATDNSMEDEARRQAALYVLCLLSEKERSLVNPLDLDQWKFWVVPTIFFDRRKRSQKSITYNSLIVEKGEPIQFSRLKSSVDEVLG